MLAIPRENQTSKCHGVMVKAIGLRGNEGNRRRSGAFGSQHGWWPQSFSLRSSSKRAICSSAVSLPGSRSSPAATRFASPAGGNLVVGTLASPSWARFVQLRRRFAGGSWISHSRTSLTPGPRDVTNLERTAHPEVVGGTSGGHPGCRSARILPPGPALEVQGCGSLHQFRRARCHSSTAARMAAATNNIGMRPNRTACREFGCAFEGKPFCSAQRWLIENMPKTPKFQFVLTFLLLLSAASQHIPNASEVAPTVAQTQPASAGSSFTFEQHVRPILKAHCFDCMARAKVERRPRSARLRRLVVKGGDSGPAIVPGRSGERSRPEDPFGRNAEADKKLSGHEIQVIEGGSLAARTPREPNLKKSGAECSSLKKNARTGRFNPFAGLRHSAFKEHGWRPHFD